MANNQNKSGYYIWLPWVFAISVGAVTLIVFLPATGYELTNYDEQYQIIDNPHAHVLGVDNLVWIFTNFSITSYYPVRLLSFAIDYHFWELDPRGYHLTNILIHLVNALLVFLMVLRISKVMPIITPAGPKKNNLNKKGRRSRQEDGKSNRRQGVAVHQPWSVHAGAVAMGLFALHPVVVEPVAWVGGREELLMTFFALACLHFHMYVRPVYGFADGKEPGMGSRVFFHLMTGFCCALACMSNAVAAVIPAIVIAYDLVLSRQRKVLCLLAGTWYLLVCSFGTVVLKQIGSNIGELTIGQGQPLDLPVLQRGLLVFSNYWHNFLGLLWPSGLTPFYQVYTPGSFIDPQVISGFLLGVATLWLLWKVRRNGAEVFGLLWFLLALVPSSQIIPHHFIRADRFLYLPLVGLALAVSDGLRRLHGRSMVKYCMIIVGVLVLSVLAVRSARQVPVWRDSITLWTHCIRIDNQAPVAYYNRAVIHHRNGEIDKALADYSGAIESNPDYFEAYNNRGLIYEKMGCIDKAISDYNMSILLEPNEADAYFNRANLFNKIGKCQQAISDYNRVVELGRATAELYINRAAAFNKKGDYQRAIDDYSRVVELGRTTADVYYRRADAYFVTGRIELTLADYSRAIELKPDYADPYRRRGLLYCMKKEFGPAIADFNKAIGLDSENPGAYIDLAWLLATCADPAFRDGFRAVELAEKCCRTTDGDKNPRFLDTLAAAYAESGRFREAVETAREAISLAADRGHVEHAKRIKRRLRNYEAGRPYHERP